MSDDLGIPDLKKAQEAKAQAASGPAPTRAAASFHSLPPSRVPPKARNYTPWIASFLVIGGLAFAVGAWRFTAGSEGRGAEVSGAGSTSGMKIHFANPNDPTRYVYPGAGAGAGARQAKAGSGMRFDLIGSAADKASAAAKEAEDAANAAAGGEAAMSYDESSTSHGGGPSAGGASASGEGGTRTAANGPAPRLNSSFGSAVKLQGMRRVSATAGFRSIQSRKGALNRSVTGRGAGANSSERGDRDGAQGGYGAMSGSGGSAGSSGLSTGGSNAGDESSGAAAGGGSGGGGGGAGDEDAEAETDPTADRSTRIRDLNAAAQRYADESEKQKKYAEVLAAAGQLPQAAYHYDKAQKAKKKAEAKEAEAQRVTAEMMAEISAQTKQPAPPAQNTAPRTR